MTLLTTPLQQQTIAATDEDWTNTVSFAKFDPSLGTLVDVRFSIVGSVTASASIENLSPAAASVQISLPGSIFAFPFGGIGLAPVATVNLGGFDGGKDFSGTSGTVVSISDTQSVSSVVDAANFAGSVTGTGTFGVTATSFASSGVAGNANLRTLLHTNAGAVLSPQYDYVAAGGTTGGGGSIGVVATLVIGPPVNAITFFANATGDLCQLIPARINYDSRSPRHPQARPEDRLAQTSYLTWRATLWQHAMLGSSPGMT